MSSERRLRDQLDILKRAGLEILETRNGKGAHVLVVVGYRGFFRRFTLTSTQLPAQSISNFAAQVQRFPRTVDAYLRGEPVDLGLGTPGAIFRRREDL